MITDTRVRAYFERVAALGLDEDLGGGAASADVTTQTTVPDGLWAEGHVIAKAPGVVCGLAALEATFGLIDTRVAVRHAVDDGAAVQAGAVISRATGPARALLTGERTALNVIGHLSGVATLTRAFVARASGVELTETRKTTPALRALEKYAVRVGGGVNHRMALWDGVLVKDNHAAAAGGVGEATHRARAGTTLPVEVECTTPHEIDEALEAGADAILLDNHGVEEMRAAVAHIRSRRPEVMIEASGGVTLETVADIAATGVDRISVGSLTHSAPALDVSFELLRTWEP